MRKVNHIPTHSYFKKCVYLFSSSIRGKYKRLKENIFDLCNILPQTIIKQYKICRRQPCVRLPCIITFNNGLVAKILHEWKVFFHSFIVLLDTRRVQENVFFNINISIIFLARALANTSTFSLFYRLKTSQTTEQPISFVQFCSGNASSLRFANRAFDFREGSNIIFSQNFILLYPDNVLHKKLYMAKDSMMIQLCRCIRVK